MKALCYVVTLVEWTGGGGEFVLDCLQMCKSKLLILRMNSSIEFVLKALLFQTSKEITLIMRSLVEN